MNTQMKTSIGFGVLMAILCIFPLNEYEDSSPRALELIHALNETHIESPSSSTTTSSSLLSIMSFNIRLDGEEYNPNNHFTQRLTRLNHTIASYNPMILGLQEPWAGQLLHMMSILPSKYQPLGYRQNDTEHDLGHPLRHYDMKVAIMYDTTRMMLMEYDYIWLSKTPRIPDTKNWKSGGIRTLNIARFHYINDDSKEILMFNTHLDVKSEKARRNQSRIIDKTIISWKKRYPHAIIILTGDFNTCPGQKAHHILTKHMNDAFDVCASTFHGWLGSRMNLYIARFFQYIVFTFHGMGFHLPGAIPTTLHEVVKYVVTPNTYHYQYPIMESIPSSLHRYHVDWILYGDSVIGSPTPQDPVTIMKPILVWIGDVRNDNFSSDHFPVFALFNVTTSNVQAST